ncbi:MAG: ABC transporter substrate-binding protein [Ruminiclostridium sp.]|nr:ABC transporter substrate-binding protein [Ruminiclostridium sp.]
MKKFFALFLSALLLAAVLCGCGDTKPEEEAGGFGSDETSSSGEIVVGGELTVAIAQDLGDSLDPYQMTAAGTREVFFNVYEGLVKPDADGNFIAAVASDYSVSEDGLTYTFPLREGVLFHNGDAVTAEDVIYSFETCAATSIFDNMVAALSHAKVTADGNTITVTLSEPDSAFLSIVSGVYIVPADYKDQATAPVGTGPFKFVSRSAQENLVMEKFADYWGEPAYLDKVTFKIFEDPNALMSALSAGSIDLANHQPYDRVEALKGGDFKILEGTMNLVQALYLNNAVEPFNKEEVRQAMCYAVNADEIMELTAAGYGTKLGSSIYPNFTKYFDESLADLYPQDIEKAKQMLADAGYPDGFKMTITIPSNYSTHMNVGEVLVEQLAQVGITATIEPVEWETWLTDVYAGRKFESTIIGFDASTLNAGALLNRWMSDDDTNMINYNNKDYDAVMKKAAACTDDEEQTALYKEAAAILAETAANVYIQDLVDFALMKPDLDGYEFYPLYVMDLSKVHYVA